MEPNPSNRPLTQRQTGHESSDVDSSKFAQHHTLGIAANQAAPGNHTHSGVGSLVLPQITALQKRIQGRTELISFASATSFTTITLFPEAFAGIPKVFCNIDTGAGETGQWHVRAIEATASQFKIFLFKTSGAAANAWSGHNVSWVAIYL